jgi:hypothetical protein
MGDGLPPELEATSAEANGSGAATSTYTPVRPKPWTPSGLWVGATRSRTGARIASWPGSAASRAWGCILGRRPRNRSRSWTTRVTSAVPNSSCIQVIRRLSPRPSCCSSSLRRGRVDCPRTVPPAWPSSSWLSMPPPSGHACRGCSCPGWRSRSSKRDRAIARLYSGRGDDDGPGIVRPSSRPVKDDPRQRTRKRSDPHEAGWGPAGAGAGLAADPSAVRGGSPPLVVVVRAG